MTNYEKYNLILQSAAVILTILGWFAVFWFGLRQQKNLLKDNAKLKVYNDLWSKRKRLTDCSSELAAQLQCKPFILMESCKILGGVTKNEADIFSGKLQAHQYWLTYLDDLSKKIQTFKQNYLEFWQDVEMWEHMLPSLDIAKRVLFSEYESISSKLDEYYQFLRKQKNENWETWDKDDIERHSYITWEQTFTFGAYAEDFMGLVHNQLLSSLFGFKKAKRKTTDSKYKVLTENGLK